MKTIILSFICICISFSVLAQTDTTVSMHTTNSMDSVHHTMNNLNSNAKANSMNSTMNTMNNMISDTSNSHAYAALPVYETYIPANITTQMKQKYPGNELYDITAVKATRDSVMWNRNSATSGNMHDSTNASANQNSTTTNSANINSGMEIPQKYNYVVRIIKSGAIETETVDSDGNPVTATTNQMNQ